jgi:circadian clock protein KaiC
MSAPSDSHNAPTGTEGLDYVLNGGLPKERIVLVWGEPGCGKTTLGLQFLLEGARRNERVLYLPLTQTRPELNEVLTSHGWSAEGVTIVEQPENIREGTVGDQTLFSSEDVELPEIADGILEAIRRYRPERLVLDSITELLMLAENSYQFYRHILKIKQELTRQSCTTLFLSSGSPEDNKAVHTLVHGVIHLMHESQRFGPAHRWLEVTKMRARQFRGGHHDFHIEKGGLHVYPGIYGGPTRTHDKKTIVSSGNSDLDQLLGGGLEEGSTTMVLGPAGTGKSTLASLYAEAAAERGMSSAIFCFDERKDIYLKRSDSLGLNIRQYTDDGLIDLREFHSGELFAGEFLALVRQKVEGDGIGLVIIDSMTGYLSATPDNETERTRQLHQILKYLGRAGVLTFLVMTSHGVIGEQRFVLDLSYVADTVINLKHFEAGGRVRKCLWIVKKRYGYHESRIRELLIQKRGIHVGPPLHDFSGILSGQPVFTGHDSTLLQSQEGTPS